MTQKDIELLLIDLSARLPYGVICQVDDGAAGLNDGKLVEVDVSKELVRFDADVNCFWLAFIDDVKPYLRPLSSMTEEEKKECLNFAWKDDYGRLASYDENIPKFIDWLNAHHFDYRGLIEKNLALDCTGLHIYD